MARTKQKVPRNSPQNERDGSGGGRRGTESLSAEDLRPEDSLEEYNEVEYEDDEGDMDDDEEEEINRDNGGPEISMSLARRPLAVGRLPQGPARQLHDIALSMASHVPQSSTSTAFRPSQSESEEEDDDRYTPPKPHHLRHGNKTDVLRRVKRGRIEKKKKTCQDKKRPRRLGPGVLALREIRRYQKSIDLLIPRLPFSRLVREVITSVYPGSSDLKIAAAALLALQEATENFMVTLLEDTQLAALHGRRVTIMQRDMKMVLRLRRDPHYHLTST